MSQGLLYRVSVDIRTYRMVRGWFDGLCNAAELRAVMRFMMTAHSQSEADRLAKYYATFSSPPVGELED